MKYAILAVIGVALIIMGGVLLLKKKTNFALGLCAVILGVCSFVSIPIIFAHALFFPNVQTESPNSNGNLNIHITYSDKLEGKIDTDLLKTILDGFVQNCEGIKKYSENIEEIEVEVSKFENNAPIYRQEEYGWFTEIEINIKIKKSPALLIHDKIINGHTLYFYLGGGNKPGLEIVKTESALFLGIDKSLANESDSFFVPIDEHKMIDDIVKE